MSIQNASEASDRGPVILVDRGAKLKQWVKKLLEQFDIPTKSSFEQNGKTVDRPLEVSEERATLLHFIDTYSKTLIEIDTQPIRRIREMLDEFGKGLVHPDPEIVEKNLFRFRQFFSSYRIDEYSYMQHTFDDFKNIIWDFADQLGEEIRNEEAQETEVQQNLEELRQAVESNSIDILRSKSREFIVSYIKIQTRKEERRTLRMNAVQKNLFSVKKKLIEANHSMRTDHLTGAYNRKSFDEMLKKHWSLSRIQKTAVSLIILDIDFFKKINDTYGHDMGDFILKECVRSLKEVFYRSADFVARIGGEEFAILLPDFQLEHALVRAEETLNKIRKEFFVQGEIKIQFKVSMGIAQLLDNESADQWLKRTDTALYQAKNTGRDKYCVAEIPDS